MVYVFSESSDTFRSLVSNTSFTLKRCTLQLNML